MFERLQHRDNQGLCVGVRSGSALKNLSNLSGNPVSYTPTSSHPPIRYITPRSLLSRIRLHNTYLRYISYNILYSFILLIISILLTDRDSFTARTTANDRLCRARRTVLVHLNRFLLFPISYLLLLPLPL